MQFGPDNDDAKSLLDQNRTEQCVASPARHLAAVDRLIHFQKEHLHSRYDLFFTEYQQLKVCLKKPKWFIQKQKIFPDNVAHVDARFWHL